jgi:hypothetical protein
VLTDDAHREHLERVLAAASARERDSFMQGVWLVIALTAPVILAFIFH